MTSVGSVFHADAGTNSIQVISYTYDAEGRRIQRSVDSDGAGSQPAVSDYYVYDGADLSMTFNNAGQLTNRYQYGPLTDQVLADEVFAANGDSEGVLWLLGDQQGTIRDIADDTSTLRKHVEYDTFGGATQETWYGSGPAVDQLFYYTGQEWDDATGLYNYNARWYNSFHGRFLSEDPSGNSPGNDPNLYRYVGNSPTNFTDPTGLRQAGNPLDKLFGSYAGRQGAPYTPISTIGSLP